MRNPKLFSSLESFHVAHARFREAMQPGENTHGGGFAYAADIGPGWVGPNNSLHFGSLNLKLLISSWVIPSSARTCSCGMLLLCSDHSRASASSFSSSAATGSSSMGAFA